MQIHIEANYLCIYMFKYTRSIQNLSASIANVFADDTVCLDTRAIVLMLAATLPTEEFKAFIDPLTQLDHLNACYKEINSMRFQYGQTFRDYIILSILTTVKNDVRSDELQRFIGGSSDKDITGTLPPALDVDQLCKDAFNWQLIQNQAFMQARDTIINYIVQDKDLSLQLLQEAYLKCREKVSAKDAFYALLAALQEILQAGGLAAEDALQRAEKLATTALKEFIAEPTPAGMLHTYSKHIVTGIWG